MPILSNQRANKSHWHDGLVRPYNIVAGYPEGGVSQCTGDSGGPYLVWDGGKWVQIGIVSWATISNKQPYCGLPNNPGVGTRLSYSFSDKTEINYLKWIQETIKLNSNITYNGKGSYIGKPLSQQEKAEFINRIWINCELQKDDGKPC
jgi:secreted trypsin-like serine protease